MSVSPDKDKTTVYGRGFIFFNHPAIGIILHYAFRITDFSRISPILMFVFNRKAHRKPQRKHGHHLSGVEHEVNVDGRRVKLEPPT